MSVSISVSLVRELLATQFPAWADLPIRRVEPVGHDNRTFRLGMDLSVRLPSHARYAAQVEKEQRWLPHLAPLLPLQIPVPVAMGDPADGYPWSWSVYRWLEGEDAVCGPIAELDRFATTLARFLSALYQINPVGGPPPGPHNFFRGGPLAVYDEETRDAILALGGQIDTDLATEVWDTAVEAPRRIAPVWIHGDVSASNLLVRNGVLRAVIDFGCLGVGDPACDLTIAWTFFSGQSREVFSANLGFDDATWARARGWALWKGLITLANDRSNDRKELEYAKLVINEVLADHVAAAQRPIDFPGSEPSIGGREHG